MAHNDELSLRVQKRLLDLNINFMEKKMFGGNAFIINDKMCIGVIKNELMLRVLDAEYESLLEKNHVREMDFTKSIIKGMFLTKKKD